MIILFTVCGRAGSKGLKNKNLKNMLGAPLLYYTLSVIDLYVREKRAEDDVFVCVNSDSRELRGLACRQKSVPIYPIERCAELSGDRVAKALVIRDCLEKAAAHFNVRPDIVVDLDITSPIRTLRDVRDAIEKKRRDRDFDIVFSVVPSRRSPFFNMVMRSEEDDRYSLIVPSGFTARQSTPKTYDMNASIYAYESGFLSGRPAPRLFDGKNAIIEMRDTAVLDIDSEEDFELMEVIVRHLLETWPEFESVYKNARRLSEGS